MVRPMKANVVLSGAGLLALLPLTVCGQAVPATPTKFTTRPVGSATGTTGASINPPATKSTIRQVTYLTLSPLRQWNSTDGKSLLGKLIAWEENVTTTSGTTAPITQSAPLTTKPTVLKNNKARLLVENKAYELALDRLGADEQKFIQDLHKALSIKP